MAITVTSINFYNDLRAEAVNWLLANVGDKIRIETIIEVATKFVGSSANPFTLNNTDGYIGDGWFTSPLDAFAGMEIGDTIMTFNQNDSTTGSFTIIDKLSDREIQLDTPFGDPDNTIFGAMVVSLVKPITGIKVRENFIENNEQLNYISKVDGSEQVFIHENINAASATVLTMEFLGSPCYQIGSATIEGVPPIQTTPYYANEFKIIRHTYVTPFILATQLLDALAGTKPTYFTNLKCLKYVFNIQALYLYSDPNRYAEITWNEDDGNSGWFNENFNSGVTNYSISDLIYSRLSPVEIISNLELTGSAQLVSFAINNTTDTPFTSSTKFVLNFIKVPYDQIEYVNNGRTLDENFVFDRALQTTNTASVNGEKFGTGMQVLKQVVGSYVNSGQINISAQVDFGVDALSIIQESDQFYYLLWVSVQDPALTTSTADKVNLIVDLDTYYIDNTDPDMIVSENLFITHPYNDRADGVATIDIFPNDEVVADCLFYIDKDGRETDDILLKSVTAKVKAKNSSTLEEFTLDSFTLPLDNLPIVGGFQYINQEIARQFHIPATEIRKKIKILRRDDLDASEKHYYQVSFAFLNRWEYWVPCLLANTDFFDASEPNNNLNHYWYHYTNGLNWDIYFELNITATKNGNLLGYTFENVTVQQDYDSNVRITPKTIKSYTEDGSVELFDVLNVKRFILGYDYTLIQAEFTHTLGPFDPDETTVVFRIETHESGGVSNSRRMSSRHESDSDTWFKALPAVGAEKVQLTYSGNKVTAKALINHNLLPNITPLPGQPAFTVYARLYDFGDTDICGNPLGKITEDGECKFTDSIISSGELKIQES